MLSHLRLAEKRGSLQAPNSEVQDRALQFLMVIQDQRQADARVDQIRTLLVQGVPTETIRLYYSEYFPQNTFTEAKTEDGYDIDQIDDSSIEWETPDDAEQDEMLNDWISRREQGVITGSDL